MIMNVIEGELYRKEGTIVAANARANMVNLANQDSFNRLMLCSSAQKQFVCLENPEPARVDSLYTPGLCYTSSFNTYYENGVTVIKKFDKYILGNKAGMSILLMVDEKNKELKTHIHYDYMPTADGFGFRNDGCANDFGDGDRIPARTYIQKPDIFSPKGLCWGKNYYTMYNISSHTLEDSVKISSKVRDNTKLCKVIQLSIPLKYRDRLKNVYGEVDSYKPFPGIGECVRDDGIAMVISTIEKNAQFLISPEMMRDIADSDELRYIPAGAICFDIDVMAPNEDVIVNKMCKVIYNDCKNFYTEYVELAKEWLDKGYKADYHTEYYIDWYKSLYIDDAGFRNSETPESIDTYYLNIQFYKYEHIDIGQKCTGMHGNKGVVSDIDEDTAVELNEIYPAGTFVTESGIDVDIVLNTAGVPNRSNIGQDSEKFINNVMDGIIRYHKDPARRDLKMMYNDVMYLLKYIAPEQHDEMELLDIQHDDLMMDILENDFVIYTNPFPQPQHHEIYHMNNAEREEKVYLEFRDRYKGYIGKERIFIKDGDKLIPTNIVAEVSRMYFIFLEYTAEKKYGARSKGYYTRNGGLSKTNRKKDKISPYAETPIKLGVRDFVVLTSKFKVMDTSDLLNFMLTTDSEIVDTFKALLAQIGVTIEYDQETVLEVKRMVESELELRNEKLSDYI